MSNIFRWDPLKELSKVRENMNRILEEGFSSVSGSNLALDIYETDDAVIVKTDPIPGVNADAIEVSITADLLTIRGETSVQPEHTEGASYLRKERRSGSFSRSVTIPRAIKADEAVATFKDNMLTITIPKADDARPKVINVKSTESPEE